jgi:hypothetical protein
VLLTRALEAIVARFLLTLYAGAAPFVMLGVPFMLGRMQEKSLAWYMLITASGIFIVDFPLVIMLNLLFSEHF